MYKNMLLIIQNVLLLLDSTYNGRTEVSLENVYPKKKRERSQLSSENKDFLCSKCFNAGNEVLSIEDLCIEAQPRI